MFTNKQNRIAVIILTVSYIILVTLLSTVNMSGKIEPPKIAHFDKFVHFCFYLGMNFLFLVVFALRKIENINRILYCTLLSIAYSILIEIVQNYVGRDFDLLDIAANSTGAVVAVFFFRLPLIKNILKSFLL